MAGDALTALTKNMNTLKTKQDVNFVVQQAMAVDALTVQPVNIAMDMEKINVSGVEAHPMAVAAAIAQPKCMKNKNQLYAKSFLQGLCITKKLKRGKNENF